MPHPPTRACEESHCYFHHEDEPAGASAIVCGECLHAYPDPVALIEADNARRDELSMWPRPPEAEALVQSVLFGDRRSIYEAVPVCPFCAHNF